MNGDESGLSEVDLWMKSSGPMKIPFSPFLGRLRQLHVSDLSDVFDLFFPRFRTEHALSSFITRGRGRAIFGDVTLAGDSSSFTSRGRERRFAGDETLQRKRYYCLETSCQARHRDSWDETRAAVTGNPIRRKALRVMPISGKRNSGTQKRQRARASAV